MASDKKIVTIGLASIEYAPIPADGGMATTGWQTYGYTDTGSCKFVMEDGESNEIKVEEVDTPIFVDVTPGKTYFTFAVANPSVTALKELFGGTATEGVGSNKSKWEAPAKFETKEVALRIKARKGFMFEAPRVLIKAKSDSVIGRGELFKIEVTAELLTPAKAGQSPLIFTEL